MTITSPAVYFEIPVHDLDRAQAFYEAVFELRLERTEVDGHPMALFPDLGGPEEGISGALAQGNSYEPGAQGIRLYFLTTDLRATLDRVLAAGGRELYPITEVPSGLVAEFADSEGNTIALLQRFPHGADSQETP